MYTGKYTIKIKKNIVTIANQKNMGLKANSRLFLHPSLSQENIYKHSFSTLPNTGARSTYQYKYPCTEYHGQMALKMNNGDFG
jgi:hypothetical protein